MSETRTAYAPQPDPTAVIYAGLCATRGCQRHPDGIVTPGQRSYCTVHAADFLAAFPRPAGIEPRPEAPWAREDGAPGPLSRRAWLFDPSAVAVGVGVAAIVALFLRPLARHWLEAPRSA